MAKELKIPNYTENGINSTTMRRSDSPINKFTFTDEAQYDAEYDVDQQGVLTGGLIRTNRSPDRAEMAKVSQAGDLYDAFSIYVNGEIIAQLNRTGVFVGTSSGVGAAEFIGLGTNHAAISVGDNDYQFDASAFFPAFTNTYDLGTSSLRWKTIYLVNSPDVSSDRRMKSEIRTTDRGLAEVLKMKPREFKRLMSDRKELGFIAQEMKEVVPEVVGGNEKDMYSIKYDEIIPVLVKAIQELKQEVEALKTAQK